MGYRLAHTMIRVRDLEATLNFYCGILGMDMLRRTDYPEGLFTNTFIGYGPEADFPTLELTLNLDTEVDRDKFDGGGPICTETPYGYQAGEDLTAQGIKISRPPWSMKHGTRIIGLCEAPDGYKDELNKSILITPAE